MKYFIQDGTINGKVFSYYDDGTLREISNYREGTVFGRVSKFYHNGLLEESFNCFNGFANGRAFFFDSLGYLTKAGKYFQGYLNGVIYEYYPGGHIKRQAIIFDDFEGWDGNFSENGEYLDKGRYYIDIAEPDSAHIHSAAKIKFMLRQRSTDEKIIEFIGTTNIPSDTSWCVDTIYIAKPKNDSTLIYQVNATIRGNGFWCGILTVEHSYQGKKIQNSFNLKNQFIVY